MGSLTIVFPAMPLQNCYIGATCMTPQTCNGQGSCSKTTGQCTCTPCYSGTTCTVEKECYNGDCNATSGACVCEADFTGPLCLQCAACRSGSSCEDVCSGRGTCGDAGCVCPDGWGGQLCEIQCEPCMTGQECTTFNGCSGASGGGTPGLAQWSLWSMPA